MRLADHEQRHRGDKYSDENCGEGRHKLQAHQLKSASDKPSHQHPVSGSSWSRHDTSLAFQITSSRQEIHRVEIHQPAGFVRMHEAEDEIMPTEL